VTTVEGLSMDRSHPRAWLDQNVAKCGYCQTGMMMSVAALLQEKPEPTEADLDAALVDHICRCSTYQRVRKAIGSAGAVGAAR
jgi:aerobic-type carbon monoxide dehydrogenase small subunit (CoxS/CutS family)